MSKALPANKAFAAPMNARPVSHSITSHRVLMDAPIPTHLRNASEPVRLTPAGKMGLFAAKIAPSLVQADLAIQDVNKSRFENTGRRPVPSGRLSYDRKHALLHESRQLTTCLNRPNLTNRPYCGLDDVKKIWL